MSLHHPVTQIEYLRQCLSNAKRPIGLFLGAGCPMAVKVEDKSLIPDIVGITASVCELLNESQELRTVIANLKGDGFKEPTIEDVLTHVRGLQAIAGKDIVRDLSKEQLNQLDADICKHIENIVNKDLPEDHTPYHMLASWIKAVERDHPVEVFTTNYDLLIEKALEKIHVPYFDGFAGSISPSLDIQAIENDNLPFRWARLWKLHGSINWYRKDDRVFRSFDTEQSPVIHPSHMKYKESRRLPYLVMMDRLRKYLGQSSAVLIICGYSFRDQHVNDIIVQGLNSGKTAIAFALLYSSLEESLNAVQLACEQPNLTVLARDGAVIGSTETGWVKRNKQDVSAGDSPEVRWSQSASQNKDEKLEAEFLLGDFVELGKFFQRIVGHIR